MIEEKEMKRRLEKLDELLTNEFSAHIHIFTKDVRQSLVSLIREDYWRDTIRVLITTKL